MAMSNFWIEGDMDGRKTPLRGGVGTGKNNGFELEIRMRDEGSSIVAYRIVGEAVGSDPDHRILEVAVYDGDGARITSTRKYR